MSTLIIRDLNDQLAQQLKVEAKKLGLSVNRYLHQIVERSLRADSVEAARSDALAPRNDLARYAGGWTQQDYDEFQANTQEFSQIEPGMWQ